MAEGGPTREELISRILYGSPGVQAAEAAIQAALKTFVDTAATEIAALVKHNAPCPELQEEMCKLQKSVIDMTMEAIKAVQGRVPEPPNSNSKGGS
jgi:hypothetical protein